MRIRRQCCAGFFEYGDSLFSADGREVIKKDLQRVSCFQMVKQRFDRHASTSEDRCAAMDLRVDSDEVRLPGWVA